MFFDDGSDKIREASRAVDYNSISEEVKNLLEAHRDRIQASLGEIRRLQGEMRQQQEAHMRLRTKIMNVVWTGDSNPDDNS